MAEGLLDSTRIVPMDIKMIVKAARSMHELKSTNSYVVTRVKKLEQMMY